MAPFIVNGPKSYFIMKKGLIKYNKCKGVTLTKTHIDYAHPKLFIVRNLQLINVVNSITFNKQQKKGWNYSHCNHNFLGASNPYKQCGEQQQKFLENFVLYIYKGNKVFFICENI
jgi:hypothetical protein